MDENKSPLASEMYEDLKDHTVFLRKMVVGLLIVIGVLVVVLAGTNLYHIYQWSQFETVVVDSTEGPANYVEGENTGGIFNGQGYSSSEEEREVQGNQD